MGPYLPLLSFWVVAGAWVSIFLTFVIARQFNFVHFKSCVGYYFVV